MTSIRPKLNPLSNFRIFPNRHSIVERRDRNRLRICCWILHILRDDVCYRRNNDQSRVASLFHQVAKILARSEEHTSELQSLMRISYAVFCLKKTHTSKKLHLLNNKNQQQ